MKRIIIFVIALATLISIKSFSQNVSNEGTDFWAVFPTHVPSQGFNANIAVFVTSKYNTEVTISCGAFTETKSIPANTAIRFDVSRPAAYINESESNSILNNRGIHIKVTDGLPKVSAYAHIYAGNRSAASLILPYETLGQTYYSMNFTQSTGGNNYLAIVAVVDNTTVLLHEKGGNVLTIILRKAGDVYEYIPLGTDDLTGVFVESDPSSISKCNRFAVFSGSSFIQIGNCNSTLSYDPLYQQLYPTVSWGKNYGIVPFIDRKYILRILAQEDDTKVTFNGRTYTVNKGKFIESEQLTEPTFVSSDKLISVAQYSLTQNCSSASGGQIIGDPEMVILNPIEYNIKAITVFSSKLQNILERYINVFMQTRMTSTFKVDGLTPSVIWKPIPGNSNYSYIQIPLSDISDVTDFNSLTLTADEGFNATAYGFGNAESYAYSAGTNLFSNNYLTVINEAKDEEYQSGCIGDQVDFKINLPYKPDKIVWTLDNIPPVTENNPLGEEKVINGQKVYVYRYIIDKIYTVIGEYNLKVSMHVPNSADNCQSGDFENNYIFNIYDLPIANFDLPLNSCANTDVQFIDQSNPVNPGFAISNWFWDFKDGQTSTDQNPKHQFSTEGKYKVTLMIKSATGCYSDPIEKEIEIYPLPISKFSAPTNSCINTEVSFQDLSSISNTNSINTIKTWQWDFGDRSAISNEQHPKHIYTAPGTYIIKLVTTSDKDCASEEKTASITISELPKANFTLPDICLTDAVAKFENTSIEVPGSTTSYTWDFGDVYLSAANAASNSSNSKTGLHTYSVAGTYEVTLTMSNGNGCTDIKKYSFTVNSSAPRADFEILTNNSLCSNSTILVKNTSNIDIGKIIKIEVYKDFENHPGDFETLNYPFPDQIDLNYEPFGTPDDKIFQVKLVAYSGTACRNEIIKPVKLKASPILTADEILPVCENDGNVLINGFHEISGMAGTATYQFDGGEISTSASFNPKRAGVGNHTITYTFTSTQGCSASVTKSIFVNQSPTAYAGSVIYMLAGGEVKIPAEATGNGLTYEWTPAIGLSDSKVLNPIASPERETVYTLKVSTNPENCTVITQVTVKVLDGITPPNSFSPNGDGYNDVWNVNYLDTYPNVTVEVFNRNGSRVYFSNGYKTPFDGTYHNEQLPVGVYYYIINPKNGRKIMTGPLTIIR